MQWYQAAEKELMESFQGMGAVSITTPEEKARCHNVLPMKAVWTEKPGGRHKCRGVICGNFQQKDPTEQVWTAQADTASVMAGMRLAQLRRWNLAKLDIKGAFMYAPLPQDTLIIVRPPAAWIRMGIVPIGTLWTVRKAVYGLRVSPRAWGQERDAKFAAAVWQVDGQKYRLKQCHNDTQVWQIVRDTKTQSTSPSRGTALRLPSLETNNGNEELLGLLICYVDDLLLVIKDGSIKAGLIAHLRTLWEMSTEVDLKADQPFTFLGLEIELNAKGDLYVHQKTFIKKLLADHGLDTMSKGMKAVTVAMPTDEDLPPDAQLLKKLQRHAGEFNWLATRTRPDMAYFTSVIASAAKSHGDWTLGLCRKVLRYLLETREQGIAIPRDGSAPPSGKDSETTDPKQLVVWSDAGYGGVGTKAQTGVLISWAGAVILARSSRQTNSALSTCEAEVAAAAMAFVCCEGLISLLEEWGVELRPPILLIDNKSALTIMELGGSWRTRYFSVRAARIAEEYARNKVQLRYCRTNAMAADGLTKMASAVVMEMLREAMSARPPALADATHNFCQQDSAFWAFRANWIGSISHSQQQQTAPSSTPQQPTAPQLPVASAAVATSSASKAEPALRRSSQAKYPGLKATSEQMNDDFTAASEQIDDNFGEMPTKVAQP